MEQYICVILVNLLSKKCTCVGGSGCRAWRDSMLVEIGIAFTSRDEVNRFVDFALPVIIQSSCRKV